MGLDSVIEIPEIKTSNSFIRDVVVAAIKRRKEQDEAQAGPYEDVINAIDSIVSTAKNVIALNEAYGQLTELAHVWDSKIYAWSKIQEKAREIGTTWDKAAKRFIGPAAPPKPKAERPVPPLAPPANAGQEINDDEIPWEGGPAKPSGRDLF
jgi:hypothetical protein